MTVAEMARPAVSQAAGLLAIHSGSWRSWGEWRYLLEAKRAGGGKIKSRASRKQGEIALWEFRWAWLQGALIDRSLYRGTTLYLNFKFQQCFGTQRDNPG